MRKSFKEIAFIVVLGLWTALAAAETVETPKTANDYYQSALQSYLTGDFDQAILWDTKALQMDSQDKKAAALLEILVSEKDTANKTVIWIGGKPTVAQAAPPPPEPQAPITVYQKAQAQPVPSNSKKLQELETRVQTVAFLMERDSFSQYRELSGAQAQTNKQLNEISFDLKGLTWGLRASNLLFILALVVACIALWKSWKNGQDIKRQMEGLQQPPSGEARGRVINIRRM